ncbi:uncharacterized protein SCHCODRAFT_01170392 [Schizophyllum commune H4-8]|nr:uncharacterized protein SCHCODRAFT_01170392 [Schizophyllum commune H4-8]KAI5896202.1 hypothetical protein SCHCODRAFT_01170392 [Schizophyllum commune H4-8]
MNPCDRGEAPAGAASEGSAPSGGHSAEETSPKTLPPSAPTATSTEESRRTPEDGASFAVLMRRNGELASKIEGLAAEKETYAMRILTLSKENTTLRSSLSMARQEARRVQEELNTLSSIRDELHAELVTAKHEVNRSNACMKDERSTTERVSSDLKVKTQEVEEISSKNHTLERQNKDLQDAHDHLSAALVQSKDSERLLRESLEHLEQERDEARAGRDQALRRAEETEERVLSLEEDNRRVGAALQAAERNTVNITTQRANVQATLDRIAAFVAQQVRPYSAEPPVLTIQSGPPAGDDFAAAVTQKTDATCDISANKPEEDEDENSSHSEVDELESPSASVRNGKRPASPARKASDLPPKRTRHARHTTGLSRPATTSSVPLSGRGKRIAGQKQNGRVSGSSRGSPSVIIKRDELGHCFDADGKRVCPQCERTQEHYKSPRWLPSKRGPATVCQKANIKANE